MTGRTTVITGAAGSIGRAIVRTLASASGVLIVADQDADGLRRIAEEIRGKGHTIIAVVGDAASPDANARIVHAAVGEQGGIDDVVLAAGIYSEALLVETTEEQWRTCLATNLDSAFQLLKAAAPHLRDGASVVALTSIAGLRGSRAHAAYAASKGGLLSLVRSLAWEFAPGARVNAVAPGIIANEMTRSLRESHSEDLLHHTPLGRFGQPEEVAGVVRFLCSSEATYITGEVIQVNGGLHMH